MGVELKFEWSNKLCDTWTTHLNEAEDVILAVDSCDLALPESTKILIVCLWHIDESHATCEYCFICRASQKTHVAISSILKFNDPTIGLVFKVEPMHSKAIRWVTLLYQRCIISTKSNLLGAGIIRNIDCEVSSTFWHNFEDHVLIILIFVITKTNDTCYCLI